MHPRQILITCGAGFLGGHLAHRFQRAGVRVRLLDIREHRTSASESGVEYVHGDIRDPAAIGKALEGVDVVVNTAFASPCQTQDAIWSVNVDGTLNICAAALAHGVGRLIHISSTIVLKPRKEYSVLRNSPLTRIALYHASRVEAEEIVGEYGRRGLSVAIVRPKTFLGPGRCDAFAVIFEWVRRGRPVPLLGSGRNRYQLLDVRDLAEGVRLLAATDAHGIFFFGARDFGTVREDLQALLDHARTGSWLCHLPGGTARVALRMMEAAHIVPLSEWHYMSARGEDSMVDISRAERELAWRPQRSNGQALVGAHEWYVANGIVNGNPIWARPAHHAHRVAKKLYDLIP